MKNLLIVPFAAVALTPGLSAWGASDDGGAGGEASPSATATSTGGGGTTTGDGGGQIEGGGNLTPKQRESVTKVVECVRKKGYDMPEPTSPAVAPENIEGRDPDKVNKDSRECAALADH